MIMQEKQIFIDLGCWNPNTRFGVACTLQWRGTHNRVRLQLKCALESWNLELLVFEEGKTGVPGEKPLGARTRTNNKLNPHMTPSPGIEPGPH